MVLFREKKTKEKWCSGSSFILPGLRNRVLHISPRWGPFRLHRGPAGRRLGRALRTPPPRSLHSLFTLTQSRWWGPAPPLPPPNPPTTSLPPLPDGPTPRHFLFIYLSILPRLCGFPFLISSVKHDYYLLMLKLRGHSFCHPRRCIFPA